VQGALLRPAASVTLLAVESGRSFDELPAASTVVSDLCEHCWLHLHPSQAMSIQPRGSQLIGDEHALQEGSAAGGAHQMTTQQLTNARR
jgi:hypothetical protein